MSYGDQAVALGLNGRGDGAERLWSDEEDTGPEDGGTDLTASLVSLGFIRAALRRSRWFWAVMAIAGLIIGSGLYLSSPPLYQASTTLLLEVGSEPQPGTAILDNQAMAQSRAVAALALQQLGIRQDPGTFLGSYTATVVTDRVLRITFSARSSDKAVSAANAVAAAFLNFRADLLLQQQQLQSAALDQQVTQDKRHLKSINDQISQLSAQPASSGQPAQLSSLRAQRDRASSDLTALEEATSAGKATRQLTTASMITGSKVIDTAGALAHSRFKVLILYSVAGFIIGLGLGVGIVILRALTSDRLYRRDDVARALGAPVKLSVPATRATRRLKRRRNRRRWLAAAEGREMQRIVGYLRSAVPAGSRGFATLAVIPVDDPRVAALAVVSLAASGAQQGRRVVVADLCSGAPAARLLGVRDPGAQPVNVDGMHLVAVVPDPEEVAPAGPLGLVSAEAQPTLAGQVASACASADLLLTLVALDPSVGADHLATWATDAVVVIPAGRSWSKIQAVGEMVRLAGTRLVSAVLIGPDRNDESLGVTPASRAGRDNATEEALHTYPENSVVTAAENSVVTAAENSVVTAPESSVVTAGEGSSDVPPTDAPASRLTSR
jgi:capsular polysaccharide biosynthesis protein